MNFFTGNAMAGCAALILSGGSGSRFGGERPKQYLPLAGATVLRRATNAFIGHSAVDHVRIVLRPEDRDLYNAAFADAALMPPVEGGATRQESARLGLESLRDLQPDKVLIHDGARPFADAALIGRVIDALDIYPAAVPALPVNDTIKCAADDGATVTSTMDRSSLRRAQTPQGFRFSEILVAHETAEGTELTDDAMVAERAGLPVALVTGSEANVKITTQEDMAQAEQVLGAGGLITRIGTGFDVHRFGPGDHVTLGGTRIAHDHGLEGHSDADAALHAITDAILGAIGDGDIGSHFPPSDPQWRGADSAAFLRHAASLVEARGGMIDNVDVTLICEAPKIGPHRDAMRGKIAEILGISLGMVSVKATTTEGLGFTGRREGVAAQAVAAIRAPMGT
jgi:2-C-methyl-D-erythritol 4-phosphate cytidylyltransferase/2-C-methyl-D-erythritol 2,4-cyclodiphosphate synthase